MALLNDLRAAVNQWELDRETRRIAPARQKRIDRDHASARHSIAELKAFAEKRFDPEDRIQVAAQLDGLADLFDFYRRWYTLPRADHRPSEQRFYGACQRAIEQHARGLSALAAAKVVATIIVKRIAPALLLATREELLRPSIWRDEKTQIAKLADRLRKRRSKPQREITSASSSRA